MSLLYWLMVVYSILKVLWLTFSPILSVFLSGFHLIINKAFWIFDPVLCCQSISVHPSVFYFLVDISFLHFEIFNIPHVSFLQLNTAIKIELFALNAVTFKIIDRWNGLWTPVSPLFRAVVVNVLLYHAFCILNPVLLSLLKCFIHLAHIDIMRRFVLFKSFQ